MGLAIRACAADDWRLWREVRRRALDDAPEAFGSTLADWSGSGDTEARWRDRVDSVAFNLVAFAGDEAIAQMSALAPDSDGLVDVISVWVDPAHRGRGVADALLARVGEWASAQDATGLKLSVKATNSRALASYERQGFVARGVSPDGPDEVLMTKPRERP